MNQKTIANKCSLSGRSLHHGRPAKITFLPAGINRGIIFRSGKSMVPVNPGHVFQSDSRFTSLVSGRLKVDCVEHVLAALVGLGITNIQCVLEGDCEPPWLDGSALPFVNLLKQSGFQDQIISTASIDLPSRGFVSTEVGDSYIKFFAAPSLTIDCTIHFDNIIGRQRHVFRFLVDDFSREIAPARSFLPYPVAGNESVARTRLPGIQFEEPNLVIYDNEKFLTPLRVSNEPVRHKILDFLGDIALLGAPIKGYFILYKPSHQLNRFLVKNIFYGFRVNQKMESPFANISVPSFVPGAALGNIG